MKFVKDATLTSKIKAKNHKREGNCTPQSPDLHPSLNEQSSSSSSSASSKWGGRWRNLFEFARWLRGGAGCSFLEHDRFRGPKIGLEEEKIFWDFFSEIQKSAWNLPSEGKKIWGCCGEDKVLLSSVTTIWLKRRLVLIFISFLQNGVNGLIHAYTQTDLFPTSLSYIENFKVLDASSKSLTIWANTFVVLPVTLMHGKWDQK